MKLASIFKSRAKRTSSPAIAPTQGALSFTVSASKIIGIVEASADALVVQIPLSISRKDFWLKSRF